MFQELWILKPLTVDSTNLVGIIMEDTAEDMQRRLDNIEVNGLNLSPCPLCPGDRKPTIYRARHTKKWMMRPGFSGCRHNELKIFSGFFDEAKQLADGWNFWVEENKP